MLTQIITNSEGYRVAVEYTYDKHGRLTKEIETTDDEVRINEYTYDDRGNVIKHVGTHSESGTNVYEYTYDEHGNQTKVIQIYNDGKKTIREFAYDAYGNRIKEVFTKADGKVTNWEKQYKMVYVPYDENEIADKTQNIILSNRYVKVERQKE
jgi:YD repeat-containing protein